MIFSGIIASVPPYIPKDAPEGVVPVSGRNSDGELYWEMSTAGTRMAVTNTGSNGTGNTAYSVVRRGTLSGSGLLSSTLALEAVLAAGNYTGIYVKCHIKGPDGESPTLGNTIRASGNASGSYDKNTVDDSNFIFTIDEPSSSGTLRVALHKFYSGAAGSGFFVTFIGVF